jgi:hypothetical protein
LAHEAGTERAVGGVYHFVCRRLWNNLETREFQGLNDILAVCDIAFPFILDQEGSENIDLIILDAVQEPREFLREMLNDREFLRRRLPTSHSANPFLREFKTSRATVSSNRLPRLTR